MPVRVRLLFGDVYIIRGQENISSLWKESTHSNYTELLGFMLDRMFDMPAKALKLWKDDSGFLPKPHPNSNTAPNNRIDAIIHQLAHDFLLSPRSSQIADRFSNLLEKRLSGLPIGSQWVGMDDLMEFFQLQMTSANIEALYGPILQSEQPTLCEDFWLFNRHIGALCKQFPKWTVNWTVPQACAARARILRTIKHWQSRMLGKSNSDEKLPDAYWNADFIRKWHDKLTGMDGFDENAVASLYFSMLWVSNVNIIPCAFWTALELYRDPRTLAEARTSATRCMSAPVSDALSPLPSIPDLTKDPLLQSVFAEALRLRTHAYITRYFSHKSVVVGKEWLIPQKKICLLSTMPAHHDETIWNTYNGRFPLETFWARRFIIDPEDPMSGPIKPEARSQTRRSRADSVTGEGTQLTFSTEGLSASWIPFGGGPRACPGRHVGKQQVLATIALLIQQFDIEILADEPAWEMDESGYGPGVQRPVAKVPFRIRRRESSV